VAAYSFVDEWLVPAEQVYALLSCPRSLL